MIFPRDEWKAASPRSQGVDAAILEQAMAVLAAGCGTYGVARALVIRNGALLWHGPDVHVRQGIWSATKSFTSTVLGLLVDDGRCTLSTRAADHVSELGDAYGGVTLGHFTTMTSGYRALGDEPRGTYEHGPSLTPLRPDPQPLFAPPGSRYAYWDSAMNQFGHVLTRIAGEPLRPFFQRRVADAIGLEAAAWDWGVLPGDEGAGIHSGSGNHDRHVVISAAELARLGHLFLNRGCWDGRQLVSEAWVDEATRLHVPAEVPWAHAASGIDGCGAYGCNWWVNAAPPAGRLKWPDAPLGTFAASGFNNNKCFVIPRWRMVVVRLGLDGNIPDASWNAFFQALTPGIEETG